MVRAPLFDENGLKKGAWSKEEDEKLRAYILRYGHWNWRLLPRFADLSRSGKSCRLRWVNYLRPDVKRGNFTNEEDELIIKLHERLGNRWSRIAAKIPGRTDNEIKNRWHTRVKKLYAKQLKNQSAAKLKEQSGQANHSEIFVDAEEGSESVLPSSPNVQSHMLFQNSSSLSPETSSSGFSCIPSSSSAQVATSDAILVPEGTPGCGGDFWTEPFITDASATCDTYLTTLEECWSRSCFYYHDDFLLHVMQELPRN